MTRRLENLRKLRRMSADERRKILLAAWLLAAAWFRVRWTRWESGMTRAPRPTAAADDVSLASARRLGRFVSIAAAYSPLPSTCLTRSLATLLLLRRNGLEASLRIGVRTDSSGFTAHAWVEHGGVPIAERPDIATTFPPFAQPIPPGAFGA